MFHFFTIGSPDELKKYTHKIVFWTKKLKGKLSVKSLFYAVLAKLNKKFASLNKLEENISNNALDFKATWL